MTRKRIRYSELAPAPAPAVPAPDAASGAVPRPRRDSTPVELARALAAARAAEAAAATLAAAPEVTAMLHRPSAPVAQTDVPVALDRSFRGRVRSRTGTAELLVFRIGVERFAVELRMVDEVIDLPKIHHVPEMPPAMLGVSRFVTGSRRSTRRTTRWGAPSHLARRRSSFGMRIRARACSLTMWTTQSSRTCENCGTRRARMTTRSWCLA